MYIQTACCHAWWVLPAKKHQSKRKFYQISLLLLMQTSTLFLPYIYKYSPEESSDFVLRNFIFKPIDLQRNEKMLVGRY